MKLNVEAIQAEIANGYINEQQHPHAPLRILNYSTRAQFEWRWTPETMQCRGLIIDPKWNVVARPFQKFFSVEQLNGIIPQEPFEAYEKMDGSLGVLYRVGGKPAIATRGSFISEQAIRATEMLRCRYSHVLLDESLTYLFEIIYPENRIVVDYGGMEDLVLLAVIETATGVERPLPDIGFPVVKQYDGITQFDELMAQQDAGREGFVARFASGQRVKVKFDEYKRLHKLLTGVSPKQIWESLRKGDTLDQLVEKVPDEFFDWVRRTEGDLRDQFNVIDQRAKTEYALAGNFPSRREAAEHYKLCAYPGLMFAMLDGKDYSEQVWKMVKPSGQGAFRCDIDL